jgi:hypothetical protein
LFACRVIKDYLNSSWSRSTVDNYLGIEQRLSSSKEKMREKVQAHCHTHKWGRMLTRKLLVGGVELPHWVNDLAMALGLASILGSAYIILIITQLQVGQRRRQSGRAPPTTLLLVRAMCAIDVSLHLRHVVAEIAPDARPKWCHLASFMAQSGLNGTTAFNALPSSPSMCCSACATRSLTDPTRTCRDT